MTALAPPPAKPPTAAIDINQTLLDAVVSAVDRGIEMTGLTSRCVGVSRAPGKQSGEVTGMIGVHGSVSGFVTVNMSQRLALQAVEGLLHEKFETLTPQVVDGAGEVTNMLVGGVKANLAATEWAFKNMTVPSVIIGEGYQVAFARGLEVIDVAFEIENGHAILASDRLLHVSLSLLKL